MMRILVLVLVFGVGFAALEVGSSGVIVAEAVAQPADPPPGPGGIRIARSAAAEPHQDIVHTKIDAHGKPASKGMALVFWVFAFITVGGALFVVTRRNLITAVMGMVGSFLGIAAVYMMLYAGFLSVVQMLVYAGAIMVLFVFVVMILNRPEDEPVAPSGRAGQLIGGVAIIYLVARLVMLLVGVRPPNARLLVDPSNPASTLIAPPPVPSPDRLEQYPWGSVKAVGSDLFGPGLFPFEAISILLLVAVVGAIAIARPLHEDRDPEAKAR